MLLFLMTTIGVTTLRLPPLDFLIFSFLCSKFKKGNKVIKIVANSCQILRLKCTKFDFGWGSAPDPLAGFKKAYF